jgi:catechol 2,3-dioxygenase-like lactoylglutathione lyase family enzyme
MADQIATATPQGRLKELPQRLHHQAFCVKDQEVTRRFMEDVLGIPLSATWCERVFRAEVGREVDYCHTFYEFADGGALAFFQFADDEAYEKNKAIVQDVGGSLHSAFKVSQQTFDELLARCKAHDVPLRVIDHGYCTSMYLMSPDRMKLEFTVDAPDAEAIAAMRRKDAHAELKRWLGGDRTPNNGDRPH